MAQGGITGSGVGRGDNKLGEFLPLAHSDFIFAVIAEELGMIGVVAVLGGFMVLAYAGGALPLLLFFSIAGRSISDVLTGDAVAIEIVRACVGGIALTLSVPLTTAIAALLARPVGSGGGAAPVVERPRREPTRGRHAR